MRATVNGIRRICPAAAFVIRNDGPIPSTQDLRDIELTYIDRIAADQSRSKLKRFFVTMQAYRQHFRKCRWFVMGGGTVIHERRSVVPLLLMTIVCALARVMHLRIAALGVGVAELRSGTARRLLRAIIQLSDLFAVRDDAAVAECTKAGAGNQVRLTGDLVFTLVPSVSLTPLTETGSLRLGLSIYPPALGNAASYSALSDAVKQLIGRGWKITCLVFHNDSRGAGEGQDLSALSRLIEDLPSEQKAAVGIHIMSTDLAECGRVYSAIDVHCGMRFHGHVLAAIFDRPFVGISVDNKIDAVCRFFEMPVVASSGLDGDGLVRAIEQAAKKKIDPLRRSSCIVSAQENFSAFGRLMAQKPAIA